MPPQRPQSNNARITAFFEPKPTSAAPAAAEQSSTASKSTRNAAEIDSSPPPVAPDASSSNLNSSASEMHIDSPTASQSSTAPTPPTAHKAADTRVIPDSEGEESDDDSDFDDIGGLGSFLGKTAKPPAPPTQAPLSQPAQCEFLGMPGSSTTKKRAPINSLDKLLEDIERRKALDAQLEQVRESLEKRHNGAKPKMSAISAQEAQSVIGPEISGERFVSALKRKQAFEVDEVWKFFEQNDDDPIPEPVFPSSSVRDDETFGLMTDESVREDLFVSGFVNDMAACGIFPPATVITWMLDQVCFERTRQDLSWAYTQALVTILTSQHFHAKNINGLLTRSRIRALWRILGAREDSLHTESPMKLSTGSDENAAIKGTWNICLLVDLLACAIDPDDQELATTVCELLIRLSLDISVLRHSDIVLKVTRALDRILSETTDERWEAQARLLGSLLLEHVSQPQNQYGILEILPLRTPRLHLFRRRLALCFVFNDASYMSKAERDLVVLERFTTLLENGDVYKITSKTDYLALRARMSILDVAVDAGATAEKYAKDSEVDRLVDALRRVFASIPDNNAQNIKRTEAKESIERLQFRLRFAVRKKPLQALDGNLDRDGKIQSKLSFLPMQA